MKCTPSPAWKEASERDIDNLVFAIVEQAVRDWRNLCQGNTPTKDCNFDELEEFFGADCDMLLACTNLSAGQILLQLQRERRRMHEKLTAV